MAEAEDHERKEMAMTECQTGQAEKELDAAKVRPWQCLHALMHTATLMHLTWDASVIPVR